MTGIGAGSTPSLNNYFLDAVSTSKRVEFRVDVPAFFAVT